MQIIVHNYGQLCVDRFKCDEENDTIYIAKFHHKDMSV